MSKTIVQAFGPIYGEPVNGTVMGRPNGSVYVPLTNKIKLEVDSTYRFVKYEDPTHLILCKFDGTTSGSIFSVVAESQDLSNYTRISIYSDSALTTEVAWTIRAAGDYNYEARRIAHPVDSISDGDTLYMVVQLVNNGTPVSTSNVIEVTAVVP